jgi:hypothetical protein
MLGVALRHYWKKRELPENNPVLREHILRIERAVQQMEKLTTGRKPKRRTSLKVKTN